LKFLHPLGRFHRILSNRPAILDPNRATRQRQIGRINGQITLYQKGPPKKQRSKETKEEDGHRAARRVFALTFASLLLRDRLWIASLRIGDPYAVAFRSG